MVTSEKRLSGRLTGVIAIASFAAGCCDSKGEVPVTFGWTLQGQLPTAQNCGANQIYLWGHRAADDRTLISDGGIDCTLGVATTIWMPYAWALTIQLKDPLGTVVQASVLSTDDAPIYIFDRVPLNLTTAPLIPVDAGPDAGADAGVVDGGADASADAGADASADAGSDADAGADAGVDASVDITPPDAGAAMIVFGPPGSSTTPSTASVTVIWTAATDNVTPQAALEYKLVRAASTSAIDTVAKADDAGIVMDWTANVISQAPTGILANAPQSFAVLVRDDAGNKALYGPDTAVSMLHAPTVAGGFLYAAFPDSTASGKVSVVRSNGGPWAAVGGAGFTSLPVLWDGMSLAVSDAGEPWFASTQDTGGPASDTYTYAFSAGAWVSKGNVVGACPGTFSPTILFAGNTPYLTLRTDECTPTWGMQAMTHNGTSWVLFVPHSLVDAFFPFTRGFFFGGEIYMFFGYLFGPSAAVYHSAGGADEFAQLGGDLEAAPVSDGLRPGQVMALAGTTIYVAYPDPVTSRAVVKSCTISACTFSTLGGAPCSDGEASGIGMIVRAGVPYVVFRDHTRGGKGTIMKYSAASWTIVSTGFSTGEIASPHLVDNTTSGQIDVYYIDATDPSRATISSFLP
ncbi:MAG: hypothetical protein HYY84_06550 [Deltaproteobacteria bacterium]|nr:hypothetical protein [Deltaproteobacteria bacterium]